MISKINKRMMYKDLFNPLREVIGRHRIVISVIAALFFIYFSSPTQIVLMIGTPVIFLGEVIRTWASGYIKKDKELAKEGPYALTRNPLYLGNFLIGLGFSIMSNSAVLMAFFLVVFIVIYVFTIKNEEMSLHKKFGDSFIEYKNMVPVFFPLHAFSKKRMSHIFNRDDIRGTFEWSLVMKHREHHTWLGIIGCIVVFIIKAMAPSSMAG